MVIYPNAKINLGLSIINKRIDGYHDLETVFLPIPSLHDELEVTPLISATHAADDACELSPTPIKHYEYTSDGITIDCTPDKNLIIRAYEHMRALYPTVGNVRIRFQKNIPFGAGLGGGSADAACMILAINEIFHLSLTPQEMEKIAASLGADCAVFVQNRPRFATGIGDQFSEVPSRLMQNLTGKWILLVKPNCAVSTAAAYRGVSPKLADVPLKEAIKMPITAWHDTIINDFEQSVFSQFAEIKEVKQRLLQSGAVYAALSGSGATVYGIFNAKPTDETIASICQNRDNGEPYFHHLATF